MSQRNTTTRALSPYRRSKSSKCGLVFPVQRIKAMLSVGNFANRIGDSAAVCMTAVLEYLTAELLEIATNAARADRGTGRIQPKDINAAVRRDTDFTRRLRNSTVAKGGSNARKLRGLPQPIVPALAEPARSTESRPLLSFLSGPPTVKKRMSESSSVVVTPKKRGKRVTKSGRTSKVKSKGGKSSSKSKSKSKKSSRKKEKKSGNTKSKKKIRSKSADGRSTIMSDWKTYKSAKR